jgi:hypothetical protein
VREKPPRAAGGPEYPEIYQRPLSVFPLVYQSWFTNNGKDILLLNFDFHSKSPLDLLRGFTPHPESLQVY